MAQEDILFNINGDSSSGVSEVQSLIDSLMKLDEILTTVGESLGVFDGVAATITDISTALNTLVTAADNAAKNLATITTSVEGLNAATDTFDAAMTAIEQNAAASSASVDALGASMDNAGTSMMTASDEARAWFEQLTTAIEAENAVSAATDILATSMDSAGTAASSTANELAAMATEAKNLQSEIQNLDADEQQDAQDIWAVTDAITNADVVTQDLANAANFLNNAWVALGTTVRNFLAPITNLIDDWNQAAQAAGNVNQAVTVESDVFDQAAQAVNNLGNAKRSTVVAQEDLAASADATAGSIGAEDTAVAGSAMNLVMMVMMLGMAGGALLKMGADAQTAIAHITGLADQSLSLASNSKILNADITALEKDTEKYGGTLADAANGMYYIISAGFSSSQALTILDTSMKAAAATGTDYSTVSNALTSILKAYNLTADQAAQVTNKMVQAVVSGKQDFGPFANAIGPVAAAAHNAGISISEMAAAEATLTEVNPRVRQDGQNLRNLFDTLNVSAAKIVATADAMGGHLTEAGFRSETLIQKLQSLEQIAGGTGTKFRALMQNTTAYNAAVNLLSNNSQNYEKILNDINHSMGALDVAFQQASNTINFQLSKIKGSLSVVAYELTVFLSPALMAAMHALGDAIQFVADHFDELRPIVFGLAIFLSVILGGAILELGVFFFTLLGPIMFIATAFGALGALIDWLGQHFSDLEKWLDQNVPGWRKLLEVIQQIADYLKAQFMQAWQELGKLLQEAGQWIGEHVTPKVIEMINNFVKFATTTGSQVIPALEKLKNGPLKDVGEFILNTVIPAVGKFIDKLMDLGVYISGHLPEIFDKAKQVMQTVLPILAVLAGAFAGVSTAGAVVAAGGVGAFITELTGPLLGALAGAGEALAPLGAAFAALATPVGAIIAVIGIIIGLMVAVTMQSKKLQDAWMTLGGPLKDVWLALKDAIGQVGDTFNKDLLPALQDLGKELAPLLPYLKAFIGLLVVSTIAAFGIVIEAVAAAVKILGGALSGLIEVISGVINLVKDIIKFFADFLPILGASTDKAKQWGKVWQDVLNIVGDLLHIFKGLWDASFGAMIAGAEQFVTKTIAFFQNLSNVLVGHSIIPDMLNKMLQFFTEIPNKIVQIVKEWVSKVIDAVTHLADQLVGHSIIPDMLNKMVQLFTDIPNKILQVITDWVSKVVAYFSDLADKAQKAFDAMWAALEQIVEQGGQKILQAIQSKITDWAKPFTDMVAKAQKWGEDMIDNFTNGFQSKANGLIQEAMSVANSIASILGFSKPDVGPLATSDQWMPDFGDLLTSGLADQATKVGKAAQSVAMSISTAGVQPGQVSTYINAGNSGSNEQTMVLKQILQEIRTGNQSAATRGTIGYQIPSTELGAINQQFNVYGANSTAAQIYNQINTLGGLAQEYSVRGSVNGLGF